MACSSSNIGDSMVSGAGSGSQHCYLCHQHFLAIPKLGAAHPGPETVPAPCTTSLLFVGFPHSCFLG